MKHFILLVLTFVINTMYGQQDKSTGVPAIHSGDSVTVIAVFSKLNATKDGYYLGNYVVGISSKEAKQWDGKKIKMTGILQIIEGLKIEPPQYDDKGKVLVVQGREGPTQYITAPVIVALPE